MKRSCSEPNLIDCILDKRKAKCLDRHQTREYLNLALEKVLKMQKKIQEDPIPEDDSSDLGESENEEDIFKEVLAEVFQDLPESPRSSTDSVVENATKQRDFQLNVIRSKSAQLAGYDACRRIALDFMKNAAKHSETWQYEPEKLGNNSSAGSEANSKHKENVETDKEKSDNEEIRNRMLKTLDLHLAFKQRDYVGKLMRQ